MADDVNIRISTKGDPKGADKVAKSLEKVEKQTGKVVKSTKELSKAQDAHAKTTDKATKLQEKMARRNDRVRESIEQLRKKQADLNTSLSSRLFPTFKKGAKDIEIARKRLQEFGGPLGELVNPANLTAAAVGVAMGLIVKAVTGVRNALKQASASAAQEIPVVTRETEAAKTAFDNLKTAAEGYGTQVDALNKQSAAYITGLQGQKTAQDQLREAEKQRDIALINRLAANGEITQEEAAKRIAILEQVTAEEKYAESIKLANEVLKERTKTLEETQKRYEAIKKLEEDAAKRAETLAGQNVREVAAGVDPGLNTDVDQARREAQNAEKQRGQLAEDTFADPIASKELEGKEKISLITNPIIAGIVGLFRRKKAIEEANAQVEKALEDFSKASQARQDSVKGTRANAAGNVEAIAGERSSAAGEVGKARAGVVDARTGLESQTSRGRQLLDLENETNQITSGVGPGEIQARQERSDGVEIGRILADLPQSAPGEELARAIADGVQERERKLVDDLVGKVRFVISQQSTAYDDRLQRLEEVVADQRTRSDA